MAMTRRYVVGACALLLGACGGTDSAQSTHAATDDGAGGGGEVEVTEGGETESGEPTEAGDQTAGPQGRGVERDAATAESAVMVDDAGTIGFRADVQMELETLPGTPAEAVQKIGGAVGSRMTKIRDCYENAVSTDPEIQGVLKLLLETNARGVVSADVTEAGLERGRITECVLRILRRLPRGELARNARLWVVLRASNTMAEGARRVREAREGQGP